MTAELDQLQSLAIEADSTAAPPEYMDPNAPPPPPPEPSQADQLAGILLALGSAGAMRFPSMAAIYTEEKCKAHAAAIAPAMERLGIRINAGETMVYLTAAGSVLMLAMETRTAIVKDIKAERQATGEPETPAPAANPETPERIVHEQVKLYGRG